MLAGTATIRPFHSDVPDEELAGLRRRVLATRRSEREPVDDQLLNTRPQTEGYALVDSPVGMAAFFYEQLGDVDGQRRRARTGAGAGRDARRHHALLADEHRCLVLAVLLGGGAAPRRPLQRRGHPDGPRDRLPGEISPAPRSWGEQCFHNPIYSNEVDKGGHFAAWEQPALFATEVRAVFRSLRPSADDGAGAAPRAPAARFTAEQKSSHNGRDGGQPADRMRCSRWPLQR